MGMSEHSFEMILWIIAIAGFIGGIIIEARKKRK